MKYLFYCTVLLSSFFIKAQSEKSLLWEISGNGLKESSYLYGTMHVSNKIAFRLDDVFFEALEKSDFVALESDPSHWLDYYLEDDSFSRMFGFGNNQSRGFYTYNFAVEAPKKDLISAYLAMEDGLVNSILFRTNKVSQDFEEETYLDMFIYQAGKKLNKPIVSLEDIEESSTLTMIAAKNANKEKPDAWLQKKLVDDTYFNLLQNAYRERNIALIDSLDRGLYTEHYLKNMLFIRNENMVKKLDSVMPKGKVFAGIGAAHLPGNKGVIEMLRDKGYTVRPLTSEKTAEGDKMKSTFEATFFENNYVKQTVSDNFFSINLPDKIYPIYSDLNTTYISPDLANGAFMIINRIRTFDHLIREKNMTYSIDMIDELLFENIPGKIISKSRIKNGDYEGLDIINKLKNGDYQRYQIFITPLEIITFKMGGKGDFINQYSDTVFNSISFKPIATEKEIVHSNYNDFSVELPKFNNFSNANGKGNKFIEGYDKTTQDYFFLRRATLNDYTFIEEDAFEVKQIQKRFLESLKLEGEFEAYNEEKIAIRSQASIDELTGKKIYLYTTLKGGKYYLLGCISKSKETANNYFNSFKLNRFTYPEPFKKVTDTSLYFTTSTSIKPPKNVSSNHPNDSFYEKDKKSYEEFYKSALYINNNNEAIEVTLYKPHDYEMFSNLDSLWNYRTRRYEDDTFIVHKTSRQKNKFGDEELNLTLKDTGSSRAIKIKNIYKSGVVYEIQTLVDSNEESEFVSAFYNNFKPKDTIIGRSFFDNKTYEFFQKLRENDSVVFSAYNKLLYRKADIDTIKHYITNFNYPEDKIFIKNRLISSLGYRKNTDVSSFFKKLYEDSYENSYAQVEILQSLTFKRNKKSLDILLELMEKDLPLLKNTYEIDRIFYPFRQKENYNLAKMLYPDILEFSSIIDYKEPIFELLADLKEHGIIKEKGYKKYKNQIINDAKIELKRMLSKNLTSYYSSYSNKDRVESENKLLKNYMILLFPFRNDKNVKSFFDRIHNVNDEQIITTLIALKAQNNEPVSKDLLISLASNINSRILLFNKLDELNRLDLFPFAYKSQKAIAESLIYSDYKFVKEKDALEFVKKAPLTIKGKQVDAFVFKIKDSQGYDKDWKLKILAFENKNNEITTDTYYESSEIKISEAIDFDELVDKAIEQVELKDRPRAIVEFNNYYSSYGY